MKILQKIISYLYPKNNHSSKLIEEFLIYNQDKPIAELNNPTPNERFWTFYDLKPLSSDGAIIARLYSDDFWLSTDISFSTKDSMIPCKFFLALNIEDDDPDNPDEEITTSFSWMEPNGTMVSLSTMPKRILLRGPYFTENK